MSSLPVAKVCNLGLACILLLSGCGEEDLKPRTRKMILQEKASLPALYVTASGVRTEAPGDRGTFLHPTTGEICWPAMMCTNPQCPGRKGDEPYLFPIVDEGVIVEPDGSFSYNLERSKQSSPHAGSCSECLKIRDLETEKPPDTQKYADFVKPYILPETAERESELDAEFAARVKMYGGDASQAGPPGPP